MATRSWAARLGAVVILIAVSFGGTRAALADEAVNCADHPAECPAPPSIADIDGRLGNLEVNAWSEGDIFIVARRSTAFPQLLCCSIQGMLQPIPGSGLSIARFKISGLDEAIIDYAVTQPGIPASLTIWRGPKAPTLLAPLPSTLSGHIETLEIDSLVLKQRRTLSIYLPAGYSPAQRYPVVYMADGYGIEEYARYVDGLISAKKLKPLVLVGVWNAAIPDPSHLPGKSGMLPAQDLRAAEYLWGKVDGNAAFLANDEAFVSEIVPLIESKFSVLRTCSGRVVAGFSDGSAWAFSTSVRHPRLACSAILLSFGWSPALEATEVDSLKHVQFFVEAGTLEPYRLTLSEELVRRANGAGGKAALDRYVAGHSSTTAIQAFGASLVALFAP